MHELWRGNANAWECDEMGHLNVKAYLAKATEAVNALACELGVPNSEKASATSLARPRLVHTRYLAEARPGAALAIFGGVTGVSDTGLDTYLEVRHQPDGPTAAAIRMSLDHVEPRTGDAFPWTSRMADRIEDWRVAPPAATAPRSIAGPELGVAPTLQRAGELKLAATGGGVFRTVDADAFEAIRPEVFTGRTSDSAIHLFGPILPDMSEHGLGMALLESRLSIRGRPSPGDRYVLRSCLVETSDKVIRALHWMLDPATGGAWATTEGVAAFLDLRARKAATINTDMRARMDDLLRPELSA